MSRQDDIQKLISNHNRRLQHLKEQQAIKGINTPPEILIEIKDIENEIEKLREELELIKRIDFLNPYRDLNAFTEKDEPFFFGRKRFTTELVDKVLKKPFVTVFGPSGSGKSSVVFAGLVPQLPHRNSWLTIDFKPRDNPFLALSGALLPLLEPKMSETDRLVESGKLADALCKDETDLYSVVNRILEKYPDKKRLLLIADQFEELYTLCREPEIRHRFLDLLFKASSPVFSAVNPLHIVCTLRADFLGQALTYPPFVKVLKDTDAKLGPMTLGELRQAIEEPAQKQGVSFEAGLVERILADVTGEPGSLPLLEFALTLLWEQQDKGLLTHKAYESIGQVKGALSNYAEQVFKELNKIEQEEKAPRVFTQLIRPGEGTEDTRRLAYKHQLDEADWSLVQYLASKRLCVTNQDSNERETVELVHEVLIKDWGRLNKWMNDGRSFRIWQDRLRLDLKQWEAAKDEEKAGFLLRGAPLLQAEEWRGTPGIYLSDLELKFIQSSIELREEEEAIKEKQRQNLIDEQRKRAEEAEARQLAEEASRQEAEAREQIEIQRLKEQAIAADKLRTRARLLAAIGVVAVVLAFIALIFGIQSNQNAVRAEQEARKAKSRELAIASEANLDKDTQLSVTLALYAITEADTKEANEILRQALQTSRLQFVLSGHIGSVYDTAFSPDGNHLVTTGEDGIIKVWDSASGQELQSLSVHNRIYGAAFNSEGTLLATAEGDGQVIIWNISSGQQIRAWKAHTNAVFDIVFSPDGTRLATASGDKSAKIWDVDSGQELLNISDHITRTRSIDFSPDGEYLAVAWDDGDADIWNISTSKKLFSLSGHGAPINDIDFSPDGEYLVTVSDDKRIIIWEVSSGQQSNDFNDTRPIHGVNFNLTGMYFVTANYDGAIKLWSVNSAQPLIDFSRETTLTSTDNTKNWSYRVEFSPDGTKVAAGGRDGKVKIWNVYGAEPILVLGGHKHKVRDVTYSSDGQYLATASWDKTGKIWNATTGQELLTLEGHQDVLAHIVFSSNDSRVLTAGGDETARVWDAVTGQELLALFKHPTGVQVVAFDPDETSILTTGLDGTIKIWDTISGEESLTFSAHSEPIGRIAFSPDGTRLASAGHDNVAKVWNTTTWEEQLALQGHTAGVDGVIFSPDGHYLATASWDHTAKIWDSKSGEEILTLSGHTSPLGDILFSPNGMHLATASDDKTAKIWDANLGTELLTLFGHLDSVNELGFSPDGKHLATAGGDGVVVIHTLEIDELKQLALNHVRPLTSEECKKYLQIEPPCPLP